MRPESHSGRIVAGLPGDVRSSAREYDTINDMEGALTYIPFPARGAAPRAVTVVEGREVLKVFNDPLFGDFKVYKTGGHQLGFWESDPTKVQRLVDAFKAGHNLKNACIYAGVQERAWYRFLEAYPAFRQVKEACETHTTFGAMNTVQEGLRTKPELAFKYIEKRGDFNFDTRKVDEEKPLQPSINVGVQVNTNISKNETQIEERSRVRLAQRLSERSGSGVEPAERMVEVAGGVQG